MSGNLEKYWAMARNAWLAGNAELESMNIERLVYAALQFRLAIEALVYARAEGYEKNIPPEQIERWQPKKVMERLLEIDGAANIGAVLYVDLEQTPLDEVPKEMHLVGQQNVLSLAIIKKHYDALGSFLHQPVMKHLREGKTYSPEKIRSRCEAIAKAVEIVLESSAVSMNFGRDFKIQCMRCGAEMQRRTPMQAYDYVIRCSDCGAGYRIKGEGINDSKPRFHPLTLSFQCPMPNCTGRHTLWDDQKKEGTRWTCNVCKEPFRIALVITPEKTLTATSEPAEDIQFITST